MGFWKRLFGGGSKKDEYSRYQQSSRPFSTPSANSSAEWGRIGNTNYPQCSTQGCVVHVYKPEHTKCHYHWKLSNPKLKLPKLPKPWAIHSYKRLIDMVTFGSGKGISEINEQDMRSVLLDRHSFTPYAVDSILSSPTVRGLLQWDSP